MGDKHRFVSVRPYLPHALAATVGVVGLPFLAVVALTRAFEPNPHFLVLLLAGFVAMGIALGLGLALWKTRPESGDIAFGELLIWGWLQRRHADDRLDKGVRLLGLDRSGHPTEPVRISPDHQLAVLQDLNDALEAKDTYTHGHSQRVERHSYRTAAAMGLPVGAIEELRLAAVLHDVGKIRIPDRVLRKPSRLTPQERAIVEEHVVVGAWMVSSVGSADVVSAVRHHHERWDGRGYPDGLAGTDIPIYSRIIAVADAYDAITSTRPYRVSSGREHAVSVLRSEAGSQFDPMIVNSFIDALPVRLPVAGALVLLSGPAVLGRKFALWLKRAGAGHLAPAAATLGAVVTLGAFMPAPSLVPAPEPRVVAHAPATTTSGPARTHVDVDPRPEPKPERDAPRPALVVQAPAASAPAVAAEEDVVLGDGITRHEPEPEPKPKPAAEDEDETRNKNDGKDGCPQDGDAGEGNDSECSASPPRDEQAGREEDGRDEDDNGDDVDSDDDSSHDSDDD